MTEALQFYVTAAGMGLLVALTSVIVLLAGWGAALVERRFGFNWAMVFTVASACGIFGAICGLCLFLRKLKPECEQRQEERTDWRPRMIDVPTGTTLLRDVDHPSQGEPGGSPQNHPSQGENRGEL